MYLKISSLHRMDLSFDMMLIVTAYSTAVNILGNLSLTIWNVVSILFTMLLFPEDGQGVVERDQPNSCMIPL